MPGMADPKRIEPSSFSREEIRDKDGRKLFLERAGPARLEELRGFYDVFKPKGVFQGIPPVKRKERHRWVRDLMENWINYIVWHKDRVIGHAAVTRLGAPLFEVVIFLQEGYRGRGIGTETLRRIGRDLKRVGEGRIWLTVQSTNTAAIRCFRKVGFQFTSPSLEPEREMVLDLGEKME